MLGALLVWKGRAYDRDKAPRGDMSGLMALGFGLLFLFCAATLVLVYCVHYALSGRL